MIGRLNIPNVLVMLPFRTVGMVFAGSPYLAPYKKSLSFVSKTNLETHYHLD